MLLNALSWVLAGLSVLVDGASLLLRSAARLRAGPLQGLIGVPVVLSGTTGLLAAAVEPFFGMVPFLGAMEPLLNGTVARLDRYGMSSGGIKPAFSATVLFLDRTRARSERPVRGLAGKEARPSGCVRSFLAIMRFLEGAATFLTGNVIRLERAMASLDVTKLRLEPTGPLLNGTALPFELDRQPFSSKAALFAPLTLAPAGPTAGGARPRQSRSATGFGGRPEMSRSEGIRAGWRGMRRRRRADS